MTGIQEKIEGSPLSILCTGELMLACFCNNLIPVTECMESRHCDKMHAIQADANFIRLSRVVLSLDRGVQEDRTVCMLCKVTASWVYFLQPVLQSCACRYGMMQGGCCQGNR